MDLGSRQARGLGAGAGADWNSGEGGRLSMVKSDVSFIFEILVLAVYWYMRNSRPSQPGRSTVATVLRGATTFNRPKALLLKGLFTAQAPLKRVK